MTQSRTSSSTGKSTILIVDDLPANLSVLAQLLRQNQFNVLVATTGENALQRVHHVRPDLILLDVHMAGMDGFETCQRLKADKTTCDIPVIIMTALTGENNEVRALEVGAVDFVRKPIQPEILLSRMKTHLQMATYQQERQVLQQGANDLLRLISDVSISSATGTVDTKLIRATQRGNLDLVHTYIQQGVDLDKQDIEGKTALIWAAYLGHVPIFKALLKAGADCTICDDEGFSAEDWVKLAQEYGYAYAKPMLTALKNQIQ